MVRKQHNSGYKHKVKILRFQRHTVFRCRSVLSFDASPSRQLEPGQLVAGKCAQLLHAVRGEPDAESDRLQNHGICTARPAPEPGECPAEAAKPLFAQAQAVADFVNTSAPLSVAHPLRQLVLLQPGMPPAMPLGVSMGGAPPGVLFN